MLAMSPRGISMGRNHEKTVKLFTCICALSCIPAATSSWGANSVTVESKTVVAGSAGVQIGIYVGNDTTVGSLVCPLILRGVSGGAFITSLAMRHVKNARMDGFIQGYAVYNGFLESDSGGCRWFNPPDTAFGFRPVAWSDTLSHPVSHSPAGVLFARGIFMPSDPVLPPDTDGLVPSLRLVVDIANSSGVFEIDTTCTTMSNHLVYAPSPYTPFSNGIVPSFTRGVVEVLACDCARHGDVHSDLVYDVLDVLALIDYAFSNGTQPQVDPACPHIDRGDVNCDGVDDIFDIVHLIDTVFSEGPGPCNPCACNPYPSSCP
jgi:hypothetical protein